MKELRLAKALTQEDMMERGFNLRYYQRIEAGRSITLRTLWRLALAFDIEVRDLFPQGQGNRSAPTKNKASTRRKF